MEQETINLIRALLSQHLNKPLNQVTDDTRVPGPVGLRIVVRERIGKSFKIPTDVSPLRPITLGELIKFNQED